MKIESLRLLNARSHKEIQLQLQPHTMITGANGSGKTTILEAISILLNNRTFRKQNLNEFARFSSDKFFIGADINIEGEKHTVNCSYDKALRTTMDGSKIQRLDSYIRKNPVLYYSPMADSIISPEQEIRRRMLNKSMFYIDTEYAQQLKSYTKLYNHKKAIFQSHIPSIDYDLVSSINEKMIEVASVVTNKRINFIEKINDFLYNLTSQLPFTQPQLNLRLDCSFVESEIAEIVARECREQKSIFGPGKDRIYITNEGNLFEKFSSYGQQKSLSIFLLMTVARIYLDTGFDKSDIVILLDDLTSGLDIDRVEYFVELFQDFQTIATSAVDNCRGFDIIKI